MLMLYAEHKKIWKNRTVKWICLIGALLNIFVIYCSEYLINPYMEVSVKQYNECYSEISNMQPEAAKNYALNKLNSDLSYIESLAWKEISNEIKNTGAYNDYLEQREQEVAKEDSLAIFKKRDEYSRKSTDKTMAILKKYQGRNLEIGKSRGIYLIMNYINTDIIAVLLLLLICTVSFMQEKERKEQTFIRTCFYGREKLILTKICAIIIFSMEICLLLYLGNIVMAYKIYGLGNLDRYIQSVSGFIGSGFNGKVLNAIICFLGCKILIYAFIAIFIITCMVLFDSAIGVYVLSAFWIGLSALLYYQIEENSYLSLWKNLNIVAYLHTGRIFSSYRNINLLGKPVSYMLIFILSIIVCGLLLTTCSVYIYSHQKIKNKKKRFEKILSCFNKQIPENLNHGITGSLLYQECLKIVLHGKVLFLLCIFVLLIIYSYEPITTIYTDEADIYYKHYIEYVSGPYTAEKEKQIISFEQNADSSNDDEKEGLDKLKNQLNYIKTVSDGSFYYPRGYELLTAGENAGNGDAIHALAGVVMIILCMSGVYSVEYESGMVKLLKTTINGRRTIHIRKLAIGIFINTIIFLVIYFPWYYNILSSYGIDGIHDSVLSMQHISRLFEGISVEQYLLFITALRYIAFLLITIIIFILSTKTRSYMLTMVIGAWLFILPLVLSMTGMKKADLILLNPLLLGNVF